MFDLERSITDWRRQMLTAGIKSPVPLEELESHLRDEMEQQRNTGLDAQQAFEVAARRMGPAFELKSEFQKSQPNKNMKHKLINVLVILAVLAIGMGLILPGIAQWRAHETFTSFSIAMPLIGVAIFAFGIARAAIAIFGSLSKGRKT